MFSGLVLGLASVFGNAAAFGVALGLGAWDWPSEIIFWVVYILTIPFCVFAVDKFFRKILPWYLK